jgi:hypothetical protein
MHGVCIPLNVPSPKSVPCPEHFSLKGVASYTIGDSRYDPVDLNHGHFLHRIAPSVGTSKCWQQAATGPRTEQHQPCRTFLNHSMPGAFCARVRTLTDQILCTRGGSWSPNGYQSLTVPSIQYLSRIAGQPRTKAIPLPSPQSHSAKFRARRSRSRRHRLQRFGSIGSGWRVWCSAM